MKINKILFFILGMLILSLPFGSVEKANASPNNRDDYSLSTAQTRTLIFPAEGTWYICQGYWGPISHGSGNMIYSLDLSISSSSFSGATGCSPSTSTASAGKNIYAPGAGTITHYSSDLLFLKLDSGGCYLIGHLSNRITNSSKVKQGDLIGKISAPNAANGSYAHLHLTAYASSCGSSPVSFSDGNNFKFYGNPALPNSTTKIVNQYRGQVMKRVLPTTLTCTGSYKAEYYNNRDLSGSPVLTRCESWPISRLWGSGSPTSGIGTDNFSVRWTGIAYFSGGNYKFTARADDGIRVYLDGVQIINSWKDQAATTYTHTRSVAAGNHTIKIEYYEKGGQAEASFKWEAVSTSSGNLVLGKSASATSQESTSYPPYRAVDGNTSTRWSSAISSTLGPQWWIVDLGSAQSINQIVIRWEAAYARDYFVGYSTASNCSTATYSGWNYTATSRQDKTISFSSVNARCIGIKMRQRAPGMNNFSIYEVEVYKK